MRYSATSVAGSVQVSVNAEADQSRVAVGAAGGVVSLLGVTVIGSGLVLTQCRPPSLENRATYSYLPGFSARNCPVYCSCAFPVIGVHVVAPALRKPSWAWIASGSATPAEATSAVSCWLSWVGETI